MEDKRKKIIMFAVIILCVILTTIIYKSTSSKPEGGPQSIKRGEFIWVKCKNPDCEYEYQMDKKDYYLLMEENPPTPEDFKKMLTDPKASPSIPIFCEKCKQKTVFKAVKCEKCNLTFFSGTVPSDFTDRCPSCGHSKTEEKRQQGQKQQQQEE